MKPLKESDDDTYSRFMFNNRVQSYLKAKQFWNFFSIKIHENFMFDCWNDSRIQIKNFLKKKNVKVLIYQGAQDFIINYLGVEQALDDMDWLGQSEWKNK